MKSSPLCLTLGDPNGIGPELVCRLFGEGGNNLPDRRIVIIGPEKALQYYCKKFHLPVFWEGIQEISEVGCHDQGIFCYSPANASEIGLTPGEAATAGGMAAGGSLEKACEILENNMSSGLVTCPLNKATLVDAGYNFPGHTDFLARRFRIAAGEVCMHLAGPGLRVSLVTRHCSLREVAQLVSVKGILKCLELTWELMEGLGKSDRPIGVCGLNPHAGEDGNIGDEEGRIIAPAIQKASDSGIWVKGPLSADTAFYRAMQGEFSAVLAMYHDQGLAPLKLVHFRDAINITLGLPFVRTSVDHGTAYDLVGKGEADYTSLQNALDTANRLCD